MRTFGAHVQISLIIFCLDEIFLKPGALHEGEATKSDVFKLGLSDFIFSRQARGECQVMLGHF